MIPCHIWTLRYVPLIKIFTKIRKLIIIFVNPKTNQQDGKENIPLVIFLFASYEMGDGQILSHTICEGLNVAY